MRPMLKIALIVLAILVVLAAVVFVAGALVPRKHSATRSARFRQSPEAVFAAISDFASHPAWRKELTSVEILPPHDGHPMHREVSSFGPLTLETIELDPPRRMVGRIADEKLPFGGTWTYVVEPAQGGARLTITEDGEIKTAPFRFFARFVFGYTSTMEKYLVQLGAKFGETVKPEAPPPGG